MRTSTARLDRTVRRSLLLLAVVAGWSCGGGGAPVEQQVNEVVGHARPAVGDVPSVILLTPQSGVAAPARAGRVVMDQFTMSFAPRLLVAPVGGTVRFTNSEQIGHNVTVRPRDSDTPVLNEDLDYGGHTDLRVEEPGPYDVSCNTHPGMAAFIFATEAPFATFADIDGVFVVEDVPPGTYTLEVWSASPEGRSRQTVEVVAGRTEVSLAGR